MISLKKATTALLAPLLLSLTTAAQDCSQLAVTVTDHGPVQMVALDVTGSTPLTLQLLAVGQTPGSTTFNFGSSTLTLGLDLPFAVTFLGFSDTSGNSSRTFVLPNNLGVDLFAQAVGVEFLHPGLNFCTSNVVGFSL